jgi:hypothetical protein
MTYLSLGNVMKNVCYLHQNGFLIFEQRLSHSRVKNKLLPRIRTFREITFFMLCQLPLRVGFTG